MIISSHQTFFYPSLTRYRTGSHQFDRAPTFFKDGGTAPTFQNFWNQHCLQLFTDVSNEGWDTHLGDCTTKGIWSQPESKLHINFLELKAVFLALKEFEPLYRNQIVLVATENTTVVVYINRDGDIRSGSLCVLLWRLLSWCSLRQIVLRARHIPGCL